MRKTSLQAQIEQATGEPIEQAIRLALRRCGSKRAACWELGDINRDTLNRWLLQYGIDAKSEIAKGVLEVA